MHTRTSNWYVLPINVALVIFVVLIPGAYGSYLGYQIIEEQKDKSENVLWANH